MVEKESDLHLEMHLRKKMKNSYLIEEVDLDIQPPRSGFAFGALSHSTESLHPPVGGICSYTVGCIQKASLEGHSIHKRFCSCTTIGRKRVTGMDEFSHEIIFSDCNRPSTSPVPSEHTPRKRLGSPRTPFDCLDESTSVGLMCFDVTGCTPVSPTPSTPIHRRSFVQSSPIHCVGSAGDSLLEELPFDLLLRIVCCLRHDDLKPVSLVCKRMRKAILLARQLHFSFTTPHRERKGKTSRLFPSDEALGGQGDFGESFIRPPTPNAPRHGPKPAEERLSHFDTRPFAPPLFQEQLSVSNRCRKVKKIHGMASHRVLFNEDELCQAVAQNSL